jgi:mannitol/fructose-specific phosphotransferase system IIA component (Ntr-type)
MAALKKAGEFTKELEKELERIFDKFEEMFNPDTMSTDIDSGYTVNMALALSQGRSGFNRDMLQLVERITGRELASPSLEEELEQIIGGEDTLEKDRFDKLVENCLIIDSDEDQDMKSVFRKVAEKMGEISRTDADVIYDKLIEREEQTSTALSPFFSVPHIISEGKDQFDMVIMRSRKGVFFSDSAPHVHAIFFLFGSMDQRHFHLVALSAIAQIIQNATFETEWLKASGVEKLRDLILQCERKREKTGIE